MIIWTGLSSGNRRINRSDVNTVQLKPKTKTSVGWGAIAPLRFPDLYPYENLASKSVSPYHFERGYCRRMPVRRKASR
ncbi:MAG: hypothetical protein V7K21_11390 [Nostoc sp.]|uniref:hypothetical protein n=1 Tax=Nostoc sp. TaxID=1180 RepID=UPI002FF90D44